MLNLNEIEAQQSRTVAANSGKGFTPTPKTDRPAAPLQPTSSAAQDAASMGSAIATVNSNTAQGLQGFIERDEALTEAVAQEVATRLRTRAQRIAHRVVQLMIAPPEVEIGDIFAETSPLDALLLGSQALNQIGGASNADSH
jgi:hypothetical protein